MNIFLFEEDLDKNAVFFKEKDPIRFNKQIVESMQLFAASMLHHHAIVVYKKDGTPYTVNRILHHPACKWLLKEKKNHYWHIRYIQSLLKLAPNHSCNKSFIEAINLLPIIPIGNWKLDEYLCIANSDMSGLENPTVFDIYKRHLENKHRAKQNEVV